MAVLVVMRRASLYVVLLALVQAAVADDYAYLDYDAGQAMSTTAHAIMTSRRKQLNPILELLSRALDVEEEEAPREFHVNSRSSRLHNRGELPRAHELFSKALETAKAQEPADSLIIACILRNLAHTSAFGSDARLEYNLRALEVLEARDTMHGNESYNRSIFLFTDREWTFYWYGGVDMGLSTFLHALQGVFIQLRGGSPLIAARLTMSLDDLPSIATRSVARLAGHVRMSHTHGRTGLLASFAPDNRDGVFLSRHPPPTRTIDQWAKDRDLATQYHVIQAYFQLVCDVDKDAPRRVGEEHPDVPRGQLWRLDFPFRGKDCMADFFSRVGDSEQRSIQIIDMLHKANTRDAAGSEIESAEEQVQRKKPVADPIQLLHPQLLALTITVALLVPILILAARERTRRAHERKAALISADVLAKRRLDEERRSLQEAQMAVRREQRQRELEIEAARQKDRAERQRRVEEAQQHQLAMERERAAAEEKHQRSLKAEAARRKKREKGEVASEARRLQQEEAAARTAREASERAAKQAREADAQAKRAAELSAFQKQRAACRASGERARLAEEARIEAERLAERERKQQPIGKATNCQQRRITTSSSREAPAASSVVATDRARPPARPQPAMQVACIGECAICTDPVMSWHARYWCCSSKKSHFCHGEGCMDDWVAHQRSLGRSEGCPTCGLVGSYGSVA